MISAVSAPSIPTLPPPSDRAAGKKVELAQVKETAPEIPATPAASGQLSDEEKLVIQQLKKTDREVKAHEQAHKNAGGQFAGSASFSYAVGPDGIRYAVGGEVSIDIAPVEGDPKATIAKMATIAAAALAPAKPSGQDRRVAALAASIRAEAQAELAQQASAELSGTDEAAPQNLTEDFNLSKNPGLAAYEIGKNAENGNKNSGNILDFLS